MKSIRNSNGLYWGLIIAFFLLYVCVGFVSTLHSITFFQISNALWLAVLLGVTYEIGQATVLFSILMSDNNKSLLPWTLMILLTALQVTANVYASFKFMDGSGSMDWNYWQRSILFWVQAESAESFKIIISWISGALLPVVALGMTALVADNLKLKDEKEEAKEREKLKPEIVQSNIDPIIKPASEPLVHSEEYFADDLMVNFSAAKEINNEPIKAKIIKSEKTIEDVVDKISEDINETSKKLKKPITRPRGWHSKKEYIDSNGDVYNNGIYNPTIKKEVVKPKPKKKITKKKAAVKKPAVTKKKPVVKKEPTPPKKG